MVELKKVGLRINLERSVDESYDVVVHPSLTPVAEGLKELGLDSHKIAIITDYNVSRYGPHLKLIDILRNAGHDPYTFKFEAGEKNKSLEICTKLMDSMAEAKFGRDSVIIALGGGVVGDVAGFVAAIYNRGIPYIQIPTTTVSQADSSVGGKTGVDTSFGKNLIGAFKQPVRVYIDVTTLQTLPQREYVSGLAETVKHGVIFDADFFRYVRDHVKDLLECKDLGVLSHVMLNNCRIKGSVVEKDPHENGLRRILNYGHTIGHAVEAASDYSLLHGEAIAIGMTAASEIAAMESGFPREDVQIQKEVLEALGLPTKIPEGIDMERVFETMKLDKKTVKGKVRFSLPKRIGEMNDFDGAYAKPVDEAAVRAALYK